MGSSDENEAAVREYVESASDGNLYALDAIISPDHVLHDPASPEKIRGTHTREFQGAPPTGRNVTVAGIRIGRCRDGRIVEEWEVSDTLGALLRIGALREMVES